jgi:formylglycine-generating enzyme required for sulfatase activity
MTWATLPCKDGYAYTSPVGHYTPNAFGLFDMAGNASEWTEDCYHGFYEDAPRDGSATKGGKCDNHPVRGGSWSSDMGLRAAGRSGAVDADNDRGFRVARTLAP